MAALAASSSFLHGDALPMMRRTQHRGQRTVWSEVPHRVAPRFRVDSTVMLDSAPPAQLDDEPYKLSLALLGLQFITPWITVADGSGRHLEQLELRLTASGDSLAGVRWEGHYVDNTGGEFAPPAHIALRVVCEGVDDPNATPGSATATEARAARAPGPAAPPPRK